MKYRIVHRTDYRYSAPVSRCRNEAHLRPRDTDHQRCLAHELVVEPTPTSWTERSDFFDNPVAGLRRRRSLRGDHRDVDQLGVGVGPASRSRPTGPTWEEARDALAADLSPDMLAAREFCFESPLVPVSGGVRDYAEPSFRPPVGPWSTPSPSSPSGSSPTSSTTPGSPR